MERRITLTEDGSHTLYLPGMDEHYHSTHGAIQESTHVFINTGLKPINKTQLTIFEVGFGTGLNAWLTLKACKQLNKTVNYFTIEKYPLNQNEYRILNYGKLNEEDDFHTFLSLHKCDWGKISQITTAFNLYKFKADIKTFEFDNLPDFNLVYFDAFAPNKQEDVWSFEIFKKLYEQCAVNGVLVTYCAKGAVRRTLQEVGFKVERLPGPPGKREMLRAIK